MFRLLLVLIAFLGLTSLAYANVIRPLAAKPGVGELRLACSNAGGSFSVHADGGGYSCVKSNCDGKGGECSIACDNNNNCNGSTPTRIMHPVSLVGILQDGNNIVRDPRPSGNGSLSGTVGGSAAPVFN